MIPLRKSKTATHHAQPRGHPRVFSPRSAAATTANVATSPGLLGTLFGLIKSFAAAANATGQQKAVDSGAGDLQKPCPRQLSVWLTALLCLLVYGILMTKQTGDHR
jgi:hypothetical protein